MVINWHFWNRDIFWNKLYCIQNYFTPCSFIKIFKTLIIFRCWLYTPTFLVMIVPTFYLNQFWVKTTLVPGGIKGVRMKSKFTLMYAHADRLGCTLEFRSKFKINPPWSNVLFHSIIRKSGSQIPKTLVKWFFCSPNGPLSSVFSILMWRDQLVVLTSLLYDRFHFIAIFVTKNIQIHFVAMFCETCKSMSK